MTDWGETHHINIAETLRERRHQSKPIYQTDLGAAYCGDSSKVLRSRPFDAHKGKIQLVFTSPPFPLNTKKSYGNLQGEAYVRWFAKFAPLLRNLVTDDGSIVIEIGNAWLPNEPVMSTHVLEAFLRFLKKGKLHLCQEFIWYNPARLPSPIEWVNKERARVKDAFTRIWWMSPTTRPKADNRKVLREYSPSMKRLIKSGRYNAGARPSEHLIGANSFTNDNKGAIPPNVGDADALPTLDSHITPKQFAEFLERNSNLLKAANTLSSDRYLRFTVDKEARVHPARMPAALVKFFVKFLTDEGDTVLDPFAGSNTTGAAAQSLRRRWLAIEAEWEHAAHSIGRFHPEQITRTAEELVLTKIDRPIPEDTLTTSDHVVEMARPSSPNMHLFGS